MRRMVIILAGLIALGAAVTLIRCGTTFQSRPFNQRPGYEATKNMNPVRVDLYRYANPRGKNTFFSYLFRKEYEIVDEPPLSFKFPDAYYFEQPNHNGGAQGHVAIHFDLYTLKPAKLAPFIISDVIAVDPNATPIKYRDRTVEEKNEADLRTVAVIIYNNCCNIRGDSKLPSQVGWDALIKQDVSERASGARYVGVINGMQIVDYQLKYANWKNMPRKKPIYIDGIDVENSEISTFPIDSQSKTVQYLKCNQLSNICQGGFIYRGRELIFWANVKHLAEIEMVVRRIINLLDRYRLPPAAKGDY